MESHVPSNDFSMAASVSSSRSSLDTAVQPSASSFDCSLCSKKFSSHSNLWQHINAVHIARHLFPSVTSFEAGKCLVCSKLSCLWASHVRFKKSGCHRFVSTGVQCGAPLVEASILFLKYHSSLPISSQLIVLHPLLNLFCCLILLNLPY